MNNDFNVYASSEYNNNFKNTFSNLNNSLLRYLKENDVIIYQFNFNDIIEIAKVDPSFQDKDLTNSGLINLINNTNKFRYKYLNHSTLLKYLQHHASIVARKTKGSCKERKIHALGPYTYSYFAKGFEKNQKLWDVFIKDVKKTHSELNSLNIKFIVLIPPISLEVLSHSKVNKLNYDLGCSTINARDFIIKLLKDNKIDYIDTLPYFNNFMKNNKSQLLFHPYDTNHPNEEGHELISQAIFEKLKYKN